MSSRLRTVCFAGLFVGCAALLGVGCSDDNTKKVRGSAGEAGEAGEVAAGGTSAGTGGAGTGGVTPAGGDAGAVSEAGQGGAPVVGAAGAPATSEAGAGGDVGAGGDGSLACTPTGSTGLLTLATENRQTVCRGAFVATSFSSTSGIGVSFTCCGASDTATPYDVVLAGLTGDGNGTIGFTVPDDAPYGQQSITPTCNAAVSGTFDINVSDSLELPVVTTTAAGTITSNTSVEIDGTGLSGVTVTAIPTDNLNSSAECIPNTESSDDTRVVCSFGGDIALGDYTLVVEKGNCGIAAESPTLTVIMQSP